MNILDIKQRMIENGFISEKDGIIKKIPNAEKKFPEKGIEGLSYKEIMALLKNKLSEIPKCPYCGKKCELIKTPGVYKFTKTCNKEECKNKLNSEISKSPETINKRKKTNKEKYGFENPNDNPEINAKRIETLQEHYGVTVPTKSKVIKEKIAKVNLKKYGYACNLSDEKTRLQIKKTWLKKYGVDNPSKAEKIKEKKYNTSLKNYGNRIYFQTEDFKEKNKQHWESLGVSNGMQLEENKEKCKNSIRKKFGVDWALQSPEIKEKIAQTNTQKYGNPIALNNNDIRKKIRSANGSKTKPEKLFENFLINRKIPYQYEYDVNGKNFDFALFDNNKNLKALVEIDGEYYHGLLNDPDGFSVRGDTDFYRFSKTPENVKFIAIDATKVKDSFNEVLASLDISYEDWIQKIINSMPKEFPYCNYSDKRMKKDWENLKKCTFKKGQYLGSSIIRNFHHSIYESRINNKPSPVEAWNNKSLLEKCIRNRFIYSSSLSSQAIIYGFNACKIAPKVSVFNPSLAKYLIEKYLNEYSSVFDPFSGFSGRMLGTCICDKKYIGQDINKDHVRESNDIISFLKIDAEIKEKDILTDSGEYECLFTCPPYGLLEDWNNKNQVNKTCDEWISECLRRYKCKKYLFVVDETLFYKDYVVEEIINQSHLNKNKEKVILING